MGSPAGISTAADPNACSPPDVGAAPLLIAVLIGLLLLLLDLLLPLGSADGVLQVGVVLAGWWIPGRWRVVVLLALSASLMVILGYFLSPPGEVPAWVVLVNRGYALLSIWSVAATLGVAKVAVATLGERSREQSRLEQARMAEERRYRTLFDTMTSGVAVYEARNDGEDFIIKDINRAGSRLSHVEREGIVGRRVTEVFPGVREFGLFAVFQAVYRTGVPAHHPVSLYRDEKLRRWYENYVYRLDSGEVVAVYDDLTENRRAEDYQRLARASLENSNDPVFWVCSDGSFFRFNQAACDCLGYSREELSTLSVQKINPDHSDDLWLRHWAELKQSGTVVFEANVVRKVGPPMIANVRANYLKFENREFSLAILRDISERKEMEDRLRRSEEAALQANRAKGHFLANMSHELRTPMNVIIGMGQLVLSTDLSGEQRHHLERIQDASRSLLRIIDDLLDFSRIDSGRLELEQLPFDLYRVIDQVLEGLRPRSQAKTGIEILVDIPLDIPRNLVGDATRLGQVLANLLDNALKFTDEGEIEVVVTASAVEDGQVHLDFSVRDTGVGVPAAEIDRLFQAFHQADTSNTRRHGGTGLGLAICRTLVTRMGGELGVESIPGRGSRFHFGVRLRSGPPGEGRPTLLPDGFQGRRVLVVDDNLSSRNLLLRMLDSLNLLSVAVDSVRLAIIELGRAFAAGQPYELLLMDGSMPGMDGLEAIRHIRNYHATSAPPWIIMGPAAALGGVPSETGEGDSPEFLAKPVLFPGLVAAIEGRWHCPLPDGSGSGAAGGPGLPGMATPTGASREAGEALRGRRILLVDDLPDNLLLLEKVLKQWGAEVTAATNGLEAVEMVTGAATPFEVVLLDLQMPVMDGFEATRAIRLYPAFRELPIVAVSASAMIQDVEACLAAGMDDHIAKPVDLRVLKAKLLHWTGASPRQG
ncbi:MAG: response regulator [Magnetococcales bacterium]|nr:response regulator [Magnetococcales bacterium]